MNATLERHVDSWMIRLEGELTLACAGELKTLLSQWVAEGKSAGKSLELNLEGVEEIDITVMQLVWAAARDAANAGLRVTGRASDAVMRTVRDAGFDLAAGSPFRN